MPNLTVGDNIMMGREPRRPGWIVDTRRIRREAQAVIDRYKFPLRAGQLVRDLGFAQRQMVEILKAVSRGARVLILDEPTSSLSLREEETLFGMMDDLKARGLGLVYISHRMAEIFRLASRLSIVKDGRIIGPLDPKTTTIRQVSELMSQGQAGLRGGRGRDRGRGSGARQGGGRRRAGGEGPPHCPQAGRARFQLGPGRDPGCGRARGRRPLDTRQGAVRPPSRRAGLRHSRRERPETRRRGGRHSSRPRLRAGGPPVGRPRAERQPREQRGAADARPADAALRPADGVRPAHRGHVRHLPRQARHQGARPRPAHVRAQRRQPAKKSSSPSGSRAIRVC